MTEQESIAYLQSKFSQLSSYKSLKEISFSEIYPIPLFHGTDKRIISLSDDEISKIRSYNKTAVKVMYLLLKKNRFDPFSDEFSVKTPLDPDINRKHKKREEFENNGIKIFGRDVYWEIVHAMEHAESITKDNKKLWNYDYFFVTTGINRAYSYASRSAWFGECGYFSHWLYTAIDKLNIHISNLSREEINAIEFISSVYNNQSDPIILCVDGIEISNMKSETGDPINTKSFLATQHSYRVLQTVNIHNMRYLELSKKSAYELDKKLETIYSEINKNI